MERMTAANPHFIRCIKPNNEKVPDLISAALVLLTRSCVLCFHRVVQLLVLTNQRAYFLWAILYCFSLCCLQISDSLDLKYVREQVTISNVHWK